MLGFPFHLSKRPIQVVGKCRFEENSCARFTVERFFRQHSIPVLSEMAVVVQRMVPAESAGVLFTCHPFSFNPSRMVVTSNFGLGEVQLPRKNYSRFNKIPFQSVVSGESDPDTFILSRTWDSKVGLLNQKLGRKNKILKLTDGRVEEIEKEGELEFVENKNWSISEKQALQLGRLGVQLETVFGDPRDIEWAFYKAFILTYVFPVKCLCFF